MSIEIDTNRLRNWARAYQRLMLGGLGKEAHTACIDDFASDEGEYPYITAEDVLALLDEVETLRAKVARVEALLVIWDDDTLGRHICWPAVPKIRAALANPRADHDRLAADDAARAAGGAA